MAADKEMCGAGDIDNQQQLVVYLQCNLRALCVYVCVCVCVRARARGRRIDRHTQTHRVAHTDRVTVDDGTPGSKPMSDDKCTSLSLGLCVCVCVCVCVSHLSPSLSLSLSHTHTHTQRERERERERDPKSCRSADVCVAVTMQW